MQVSDNKLKFDRKISLQSLSTTSSDITLNPQATWTTFATIKASVQAKVYREIVLGEQLTTVRNMIFTIRYRTDVDETDQILYLGKAYDIQGIEEVGRKQFLRIEAIKR